MEFPISYAAIIGMAAFLMYVSSTVFVCMGEPEATVKQEIKPSFAQYLRDGIKVFHTDRTFPQFVYAQWCGGTVLMAMPFYIVQASTSGFDFKQIVLLLGAQTAGALVSNAIWGWWGDRLGKGSLLQAIAFGRIFPAAAIILLIPAPLSDESWPLYSFIIIFVILGALAKGLTIAVISFLMEISPDDLRPAYSGYFNAITARLFYCPFSPGSSQPILGSSSSLSYQCWRQFCSFSSYVVCAQVDDMNVCRMSELDHGRAVPLYISS